MAATVGLVSLAILLCVLLSVVFDVYLAEPGRSLYTTRFRLRRLRNWLPMGLAYCAFYCARYNIAAANTPTIESEADRLGADVVVLGTHGRTGLGRILMGSVATDVVKKKGLPVILVHQDFATD